MDKESALKFLQDHQPMPSDESIDEELITVFDEVRKYFIDNPDPACIPLFINSFGDGSGHGVYQLCDDVFRKYAMNDLVPHLISGLRSDFQGVKYWSAQFSMEFSDIRLLSTLIDQVNIGVETGTRYFCVSAIGFIYEQTDDKKAAVFIQEQLKKEMDQDILEVLGEYKS